MVRLNLKLISTVLLGVLFLMMVHNVVPHTHHDHGESDALFENTSHHHHSHDKSHKHADSHDSEEQGEDDFLLLFFVHHFHSSPTNNFILTAQLENTIPIESFSFPQLFLHASVISSINIRKQISRYHKGHKRLFENTCYPNSSSRAPPSLG